jgi:hypothetical protein
MVKSQLSTTAKGLAEKELSNLKNSGSNVAHALDLAEGIVPQLSTAAKILAKDGLPKSRSSAVAEALDLAHAVSPQLSTTAKNIAQKELAKMTKNSPIAQEALSLASGLIPKIASGKLSNSSPLEIVEELSPQITANAKALAKKELANVESVVADKAVAFVEDLLPPKLESEPLVQGLLGFVKKFTHRRRASAPEPPLTQATNDDPPTTATNDDPPTTATNDDPPTITVTNNNTPTTEEATLLLNSTQTIARDSSPLMQSKSTPAVIQSKSAQPPPSKGLSKSAAIPATTTNQAPQSSSEQTTQKRSYRIKSLGAGPHCDL